MSYSESRRKSGQFLIVFLVVLVDRGLNCGSRTTNNFHTIKKRLLPSYGTLSNESKLQKINKTLVCTAAYFIARKTRP